jgi:hypothetical protein
MAGRMRLEQQANKQPKVGRIRAVMGSSLALLIRETMSSTKKVADEFYSGPRSAWFIATHWNAIIKLVNV